MITNSFSLVFHEIFVVGRYFIVVPFIQMLNVCNLVRLVYRFKLIFAFVVSQSQWCKKRLGYNFWLLPIRQPFSIAIFI